LGDFALRKLARIITARPATPTHHQSQQPSVVDFLTMSPSIAFAHYGVASPSLLEVFAGFAQRSLGQSRLDNPVRKNNHIGVN
jgi:hypothetical protein